MIPETVGSVSKIGPMLIGPIDAVTSCVLPAFGLLEVLVAISTATMCLPRYAEVKVNVLVVRAKPPAAAICVQSVGTVSVAV
jgi:hypothetical protein